MAASRSEDAGPADLHTVTTAPTGELAIPVGIRSGTMRGVWGLFGRCGTAACWWGATVGALPHVLHFAGPLAGAAFVTGAGGTLLFAGVGLVVAIPLLWHEYRHTGSWRAPALFLVASAVLFMVSTLVVDDLLGNDIADPPGPIDVDPHGEH